MGRGDMAGAGKNESEISSMVGAAYSMEQVFDTEQAGSWIAELLEAKQLAEAVALSRARILAAANFFYITLDEAGVILEWCPAAERMFGIPIHMAIASKFECLAIDLPWEEIKGAMAACYESYETVELECVRFRRQGRDISLRLHFSLTFDDRSIVMVIIGEDITHRMQLERDLTQAQKLESIGELAAGIAHEINTPIQYVGDNIRYLQEAFEGMKSLLLAYEKVFYAAQDGVLTSELLQEAEAAFDEADLDFVLDEIPLALSQSLEGAERIAEIVAAMRDFSHPGVEKKVAVDLNRAIENTLVVARHEWKNVAEIELRLDENLPQVPCYPGEINQVFLNIIVNAAQAIEAQQAGSLGSIRIESKRAGDFAEIRIEDSGPGIPEAIQDRIFDPFFTTKEAGKGTGQGLAIAHSVVTARHGGKLTFTSTPGKGTTFIIQLPL